MSANGNGGHGNLWKTATMALAALAAAALGWLTGVRSDLDTHTKDIQKLQIQVEIISGQVEKVDEKLDLLLRRAP